MSNTVYKVYTSLWAGRLSKIAGLISPEQKGFCKTDGTGEHTALLQNAVHQTVNNNREMVVAWLDLTNAFGSVPTKWILKTVKAMGFPERFLSILKNLYSNSTTAVKTQLGKTSPIKVAAGVKQGDPISPILFNIAMEPLIRK